jgi:hypothetical protein
MDRTAARRVRKYRIRQKADRGIARVEVQIPEVAVGDIKTLSGRLRHAVKRADAAGRQIDLILGTVKAPRPRPIDTRNLIHCLTTSEPESHWRSHIEALFEEVSAEAIHDLVLAKVLSFEDLYRGNTKLEAEE